MNNAICIRLRKVTPLTEAGNVKAFVQLENYDGELIQARIIKQAGSRAYLDTQSLILTHKQKRHLQREAVTTWANLIGDTWPGLLDSEHVFKGSRFNCLGVQLRVFCPVCERNTLSEFSETERGLIRNACYFCGTMRKGKPYISKREADSITERIDELNACKGKRGTHEAQTL